jgi:hypothetical protein
MKPTLIMLYDVFNVLNFICKDFIEEFCSYARQGNWSIIFLFALYFSGLGSKVILAL